MNEKPRFIRKGGRIIPIFGKNKNDRRSNLNKIDMATGAGVVAATTLLFKRKKVAKTARIFSFASGLTTSVARFENEDSASEAIKQDVGGWASKLVGGVAAGALSFGSLKGLNKLAKLRKLKK